jgi:hypothetical protein
MHETACENLIYFCKWEYMKKLFYKGEITDMRDMLQYTVNGAAGMRMKQRSIKKATSAAVNKFISPLPMQEVISNSKLVKYENILYQNLCKILIFYMNSFIQNRQMNDHLKFSSGLMW